jgi:Zn-dependent oligopeptidase
MSTPASRCRSAVRALLAARHFGAGCICCAGWNTRCSTCGCTPSRAPATRIDARWRARSSARSRCCTRPASDRWPNSFLHVFDGSYAAGYYGYHWAEVLSADAYAAFEEAGVFDPATGARWRQQVLETGGSRPALENFVAFRGREPRLDALLRHQGLA